MLGLSILAVGFLVAVQYLPRSPQRILTALFMGFMLWRMVDIAIQMQTNLTLLAYWDDLRKRIFIAILLLSGVLAVFLPRITEPVVRAVGLVIAAFAFCTIWIIPQLLHIMLTRQPDESAAFIHLSPPSHSNSNQRIIWILYDELSYDQAFDHPAPGMKLPNLDRLRAESVSFSNLNPAGFPRTASYRLCSWDGALIRLAARFMGTSGTTMNLSTTGSPTIQMPHSLA